MSLIAEADRLEARRHLRRDILGFVVLVALLLAWGRTLYDLGAAHADLRHARRVVVQADSMLGVVLDSVRAIVPPPCLVGARNNPACPDYLETLEAGTDSAQYERNRRRGVR